MRKRAQIAMLLGAGASIEFGIPGTSEMTDKVSHAVKHCGVENLVNVYEMLEMTLKGYLNERPNFEDIYHVVVELYNLLKNSNNDDRAFREFRYLLSPFLKTDLLLLTPQNLSNLEELILDTLAREFKAHSLESKNNQGVVHANLRQMLGTLRQQFDIRIHTLNYDDVLLQALDESGCEHGFTTPSPTTPGELAFDSNRIMSADTGDVLCHLHGSIHFGVPTSRQTFRPVSASPLDIHWYKDPSKAFHTKSQSANQRMDGGQSFPRTLITGKEKLAATMRSPFKEYFHRFQRDLMTCDLLYVIGYGFTDYHVNEWLIQSRERTEPPTLIYVDFFKEREAAQKQLVDPCLKSQELSGLLRLGRSMDLQDFDSDKVELSNVRFESTDANLWLGGFSTFLKGGAYDPAFWKGDNVRIIER